jgi:hypothetical protein
MLSLGTEGLKCAKLFCFDDREIWIQGRVKFQASPATDRVTFHNWTLVPGTITTTWFCRGSQSIDAVALLGYEVSIWISCCVFGFMNPEVSLESDVEASIRRPIQPPADYICHRPC